MNPHEALKQLLNDPYVGPASEEAAKTLFNAFRKQMYRRQRLKAVAAQQDEAIARKNERIKELEVLLAQGEQTNV